MGGKWLEAIRESRNRIFLLLISMDLPTPERYMNVRMGRFDLEARIGWDEEACHMYRRARRCGGWRQGWISAV